MFATKGRLKLTLLVVGVLAVGLGLYGVFHPKEAEADHSSLSCVVKIDKVISFTRTPTSMSYTGEEDWEVTNCSRCRDCDAGLHRVVWVRVEYTEATTYKHRWPLSTNWNHCHVHTATGTTYMTRTRRCSGCETIAIKPSKGGKSRV